MMDMEDLIVDNKKGRVKIPFIDDDDDDEPLPPPPQTQIQNDPPVREEAETTANAVEDDADNAEGPDILVDPIDMLTVVRLKDILREQKLKVSGTKQELRDRLRDHVERKIEDTL